MGLGFAELGVDKVSVELLASSAAAWKSRLKEVPIMDGWLIRADGVEKLETMLYWEVSPSGDVDYTASSLSLETEEELKVAMGLAVPGLYYVTALMTLTGSTRARLEHMAQCHRLGTPVGRWT